MGLVCLCTNIFVTSEKGSDTSCSQTLFPVRDQSRRKPHRKSIVHWQVAGKGNGETKPQGY